MESGTVAQTKRKLDRLETLHTAGLIDAQEYRAFRRDIITSAINDESVAQRPRKKQRLESYAYESSSRYGSDDSTYCETASTKSQLSDESGEGYALSAHCGPTPHQLFTFKTK
jgi:hypothetical protein